MNVRVKAIISEIDILIAQFKNRKNAYKEQVLNQLLKENKNCDSKDVSVTECHVISIIGSEVDVNGIRIAESVGMTRGGISKIIASLIKKELIISYQDGINQKKIFYKLTALGEMFNKKHNQWHEERERALINTITKYTEQEQEIILRFIKDLQKAKI